MRKPVFLILVLVSGAAAGLVHGGATLLLVEPYLDYAIEIENQQLFVSGAAQDTAEFRSQFDEYRLWQKSGMVLGGVLLGMSTAALFGIVYSLSIRALPGRNGTARSLVLAGMMFAVLYIPTFLKYPPVPPAEGSPETLAVRTALHLSLMAILGLGAVGFHRVYRRIPHRRILVLAGYVGFAVAVTALMPASPDEPSAMPGVWEFRAMSALSAVVFWASLGIILGLLWDRYASAARLHAPSR
ncbi:MAG: CbtA family protein [Nitrosopumilaceae archaeon]|nr:CbtA family protein [Nitrosopumilaceae archaeon]